MKAHDFFKLLEKANEFKELLGELKTRLNIVANDTSLGCVYSYKDFKNMLNEEFHPDAKDSILHADVETGSYNRQFKISYTFDGEKRTVKLFAE